MRGSTCTIDARALDAANTRSFSDGTTRASAVPRPSIDGGGRNNFTKSSISMSPSQVDQDEMYYVCKLSHKSYLWLINFSHVIGVESRGKPNRAPGFTPERPTRARTSSVVGPEASFDVFLGLESFV